MANNRDRIEGPKPWEMLALYLAYLTVAKDVPTTLRMSQAIKLVPAWLRNKLLPISPHPDMWIIVGFTLTIIFASLVVFLRPVPQQMLPSTDNLSAEDVMGRVKLAHYIKSFGLVWIREKLLDRLGVFIYGTFRVPSDWEGANRRTPWADRLTFSDGRGVEYQYSRDHRALIVRHHGPETNNFGKAELRPVTWNDAKVLLVASNYFWRWALVHFLKGGTPPRPFSVTTATISSDVKTKAL